jgi:hypothetical protein
MRYPFLPATVFVSANQFWVKFELALTGRMWHHGTKFEKIRAYK